MRYSVVHLGVPIGVVDLPEGRWWAGGLLEPLPAYGAIRPVLERASAIAGPSAAAGILALPAGDAPDERGLSWEAAETLRRAAALEFELRDAGGLRVAAEVVRLADPGDGKGPRVRATFRAASAGPPARLAPTRRDDGAQQDLPPV
ncbi:MAG TPA: hypothetical protein VEA99_21215 [Gemmatimonadaceae bacterium]|nr:hypothetical protein [Gemmatimonadaceae bacterium]